MEIHTPISLWERYDRRALPLMTTTLRETRTGSYSETHVYFNGEAAIDGCTRIYAVLFTPLNDRNGAGVVYLGDVSDPISADAVTELLDAGYTVLWPDYAGRSRKAFTIYPASLQAANCHENPDCFTRLPDDPKLSCWYIWTTVALRAFTFLEQTEGVLPHKICYFGVRTGGIQAVKAAALNADAACTVTLFNAGDIRLDPGADEAFGYRASLDNTVYAQLIKRPYLIVCSSNPADDSLPYMSGLYAAADRASVKMMIVPHSMDYLDPAAKAGIDRFMQACLDEPRKPLPAAAEVTAKNSEGMLYFSVDTKDGGTPALYLAAGGGSGVYRNWRTLPLTKVGEGEYFARVAAVGTDDAIHAFAVTAYDDGLMLSGEVLNVSLKSLGISPKTAALTRLIYEAEHGTDGWLILSGESARCHTLALAEGAHGISGVTSLCGEMSTLKVGDAAFRGRRDGTLQMVVYMPSGGRLELIAVSGAESGFLTYHAYKTLAPDNEWQKVLLSETDLHADGGGTLPSFERMVCLTLRFEGELLINSLLWI